MAKNKAYWMREAKALDAGNLVLAKALDNQTEELLRTRQAVADVEQLNGAVEMLTDMVLSFWLYHTAGQKPANFDMELVREWLLEQSKLGTMYYRKNALANEIESATGEQ